MKKKTISFSLIFVIASLGLNAQNRNINFEKGTFQELKAKAIKENKLIFIHAYTTWCDPCKWLEVNVFTNDKIADFYNANFINAKIDMEKGEGIELAKKYEVMVYPNLLFIDGIGNLQHRNADSKNVRDFMALASNAKNKDQNFAFYKSNYESSKSNMDFLQKYISLLSHAYLDLREPLTLYFDMQKDEAMFNHKNWEMIEEYSKDMNSKEFKYLIANKKKYDGLYSEHEVSEKVDEVHCYTLLKLLHTKPFDQIKYDQTKAQIISSNAGNTRRVIFDAELMAAKEDKDWNAFAKLANDNLDKYYSKDADVLNDIAWDYFEHINDSTLLAKAEAWSKLATELNPSYSNLDTYASILYKNGKKDLAKSVAGKAIQIAKRKGVAESDYQTTSDLLKKITDVK